MKKLLVATTNPSKFAEAVSVLEEDGLSISGLKDFPGIKQVGETGATFEENAILKAKGYFEQTHVACVADDGGLAIDYLDGAPGVNSHRWIGHKATDLELAEAVLKKLEGVPREKRSAKLGGVIAFYDGTHLVTNENYISGYIADRIMGTIKPGFPYRAILIVDKIGKPYSDLTHDEHELLNFRRRNFAALKPKILELLK